MSFSKYFRPLAVLALPAAVLAQPAPAVAQADLLVAPTRVVLNGGGSTQVILSNIGPKEATYRISLELRRMDGEGDLIDVAEADANEIERAAIALVRYSPRRITLPPNQPQSVRISARPGPELPDGEYRVHMMFRGVPAPVEAVLADGQAPVATGLAIRLIPVYGITIPLIVRKGQLEATATIANPRIERQGGRSLLHLDMTRSGSRSVFGELIARPRGGAPVTLLRGIAVYPEITKRSVQIVVSDETLAKIRGPVSLEYRELPENGGALIAQVDTRID